MAPAGTHGQHRRGEDMPPEKTDRNGKEEKSTTSGSGRQDKS
jgi:hypothetical protein